MKKKINLKQLLGFIPIILVSLILGAGMGYYFAEQENSLLAFILSVLFMFLAFFLHVIIHEAGHLVFGLLSGYKFLSFRVFSFCLIKNDSIYGLIKLNVPGTLGQCLMIPTEKFENFKYKLYLVGGVLANVIASLLSLAFFSLNPVPVIIFAVIGLFLAITNIIPNGFNDGSTLKLANSSKENEELLFIQLEVNAKMSLGATYTELPEQYFENKTDQVSYFSQYQSFLKIGLFYEMSEFGRAKELLESMWLTKDELILPYQIEMKKELLFCLLLLEPDDIRITELAQDKHVSASLKLKDISNQKILAGLAFIENKNKDNTLEIINYGINWNKNTANIGGTKVEKQVLMYLKEFWQLDN